MQMIVTPADVQAAATVRQRDAALRAWLGKRNSYLPEEVPEHLKPLPTNEERGRAELVFFVTEPTAKGATYCAYLSSDRKRVTTWMGDTLATITKRTTREVCGSWLTNERGTFEALGIDGRTWKGEDNGPGMYCRMKPVEPAPFGSRPIRGTKGSK